LLSAFIDRVSPVPSFTTVTLAPERTAPVTSVTVPRMVPLTACPNTGAAIHTAIVIQIARTRLLISPPENGVYRIDPPHDIARLTHRNKVVWKI
jgi:hypothetical protein